MRSMGKRAVKWLVAAALCALPVVGHGATIRSTDIYAADGTSGQTLTTGNGIKTGHIQNGAITNAKIFGNISGAKLKNSSVTGAKIAANTITSTLFAAGAVNTAAIANGNVTTAKIATGAVTDNHISGTISGSKLGAHGHYASDISGAINIANLPVGTSTGTVAAGDHTHDGAYQKKYANVIVVAKSGGDFTDPVAALNSILDSSANNPYLVKIMPGVYNLGSSLQMIPYVDIEGSGANVTKITYAISDSNPALFMSDNTELRALAINSSMSTFATSIQNNASTNVSVKDVNINCSNGNPAYNQTCVVNNYYASLKLNNVKVIADAADHRASAVSNNGNIRIENSELNTIGTIVYGLWTIDNSSGGSLLIANSTVDVSQNGSSMLIRNNGSIAKCINVFDSSYNMITCP